MKILKKEFEKGFMRFVEELLAKKWPTVHQKEEKNENGDIALKSYSDGDEKKENGSITYKTLQNGRVVIRFEYPKNKGYITYIYKLDEKTGLVSFQNLEAAGSKKVLKDILPYKKTLEKISKK